MIDLGRIGCRTLLHLLAEPTPVSWVLADRRPVLADDLFPESPLTETAIGQPRADALVEALDRPEITACSGPEMGPEWARQCLEPSDLCLLAADLVAESRLWAAHDAAFGRGIPVLAGLCLGSAAWLGPRSLPGSGGCLRCAALRIETTTGSSPFAEPQPPDRGIRDRLAYEFAAEAGRILRGEEPTTIGALRYLEADDLDIRHRVLRTPECPSCGEGGPFFAYRYARPAALEEAERSPEHILEIAPDLISPLTGPIRAVGVFPAAPGVPQLEHWWSEVEDPLAAGRTLSASGVDPDRASAQAAALGEGLERLASSRERDQDTFVATYEELGDDAVDPAAWDLFHPQTRAAQDFPFAEQDPRRPQRWLWGVALPENRPVAIPVERVFVFTQPTPRHDVPVVSGFATGTSFCEATLRGLLEVIERDAFWIAWAARLPLRHLEVGGIEGPFSAFFEAIEAAEVEARLATIELDHGLPLVVGISRSHVAGTAATTVSASASDHLYGAARGALKELVATRRLVRSLLEDAQGHLPRPLVEEVTRMGDQGLLYARPEMMHELDAWWHAEPSIDLPIAPSGRPARERLWGVLGALTRTDLEVYSVNITPPELAELGLCMTKTLVPGMYPMNFDSRYPHLGGPRLASMRRRLGLDDLEEFRTLPHPFP